MLWSIVRELPSSLWGIIRSRLPPWLSHIPLPKISIFTDGRQSCAVQPPAMIMAETFERLEPLKTLHETRANDQFVEALVFEIPAKLASQALSIIKPVIQEAPRQHQLHHFRRVIHLAQLPQDLLLRRVAVSRPNLPCVFLLQAATQDLADAILKTLRYNIREDPALVEYSHVPRCFPIAIPKHPPLNEQQAKVWSERFWPTIFNPAAQLLQDAPPLHLLRKIKVELDSDNIEQYINLAESVAQQASEGMLGLDIGAVVVDPATKHVVAVAGDARYHPYGRKSRIDDQGGRPEYHALMRVVSMVANKELKRRLAAGSHTKFADTCAEGVPGQPVNDLEKHYVQVAKGDNEAEELMTGLPASQSTIRSEGYLCSGLDLYLTHEPCVCCAMAMIHSRFRSCIFIKRMTHTGALCARVHQSTLGYGLFWRRELNWRVLTFQYKRGPRDGGIVSKDMFHA